MSTLTIRVAESAADTAAVIGLRDTVYVRDQGRLADVSATADTFDRFDPHATYLLALDDGRPVGTVKVIPDAFAGLPCDDTVDLSALRVGNRLAEIGHLMTVPEVRSRTIGMRLMRAALVHAVTVHGATHILGDFFAEDDGGLRGFYLELGFVPVSEPYRDERFSGAPLSVVAAIDLADAARRCHVPPGSESRALRYFFDDYPDYPDSAAPLVRLRKVAG